MNTILRKETLTETYNDMQGLISGAVWKFWMVYGGDIDDLTAQANLIFIYAFDAYDANKAKLTTWLMFKIKKGLLSYMREQNHWIPATSLDNEDMGYEIQSAEHFSVIELLDEMERDAHIILQLFLDTPKGIIQNALEDKKRYDHLQGYMRKRMRNRLRQMGWTLRRITEAFNEIKEVINY